MAIYVAFVSRDCVCTPILHECIRTISNMMISDFCIIHFFAPKHPAWRQGYIQGTPPQEGSWDLALIAFATVTGRQQEAVVETIRIIALSEDTTNPKFGPGGLDCVNGEQVDAVEFDSMYSCDCDGTGFFGDRCERVECAASEITNVDNGCDRCLFGTVSNSTHCLIQNCPSDDGQPCVCSSEGFVTENELLSNGQVGRPRSINVVCTGLTYPSLYVMPPMVSVLELRNLSPDMDPRTVYSNLPEETVVQGNTVPCVVQKVVVSSGSFRDGNGVMLLNSSANPLASGTTSTANAEIVEIQPLPECVYVGAAPDELPPVAICSSVDDGCEPCPAGSYLPSGASGNNVSECRLCSAGGFFANSPGRLGAHSHCDGACSRCPAGTYSPEAGATSRDDCIVCPRGTDTNSTADYRACPCLYVCFLCVFVCGET